MLIPTLVMGVLAVVLVWIGYSRGQGQHLAGLKAGWEMTLITLPMLALAFIVSGMIQSLVPASLISKWVGAESGARGILVGSVVGGLAPGGPYISMPIAATLLQSGASVGTVVAFVTGWAMWAITRLPLEIGILGWRLTVARLVSTLFFPPLAGFIAQALFGKSAG